TALGFISLLTAPGTSIKNMGFFLGFGVMIAMIFSLFFIPAALSFFNNAEITPGSAQSETHERHHAFLDHLTDRFTSLVIAKKNFIIVSAAALLVFSGLGIFRVQVEADQIKYFKDNNIFVKDTRAIERHLGGVVSLDVIIEGREPDKIKQPEILQAIWDFQKFCEKQELVSYTFSIADYIRRINYVMHDNNAAYERIPGQTEMVEGEKISGQNQIAQYLLLYEMSGGNSIDSLADSAYSRARISVRLKRTDTQSLKIFLAEIYPYIKTGFPGNVEVKYTNHFVRNKMSELIVQSQTRSLAALLVMILAVMSIMFKSPAAGILTTIPILLAVLLNFAVMWISGVTLNIGTSIIASVGMGVGIDYAIHYYSRFRELYNKFSDYNKTAAQALRETAKPIMSNALAVGTGFLVLIFSEYSVIANMGWIISLSMITTAVFTLTILPALILIIEPKI
ncbi:MAG TPA: hypothetical protein DC049_11610, partial [Spirochaetia bacterium]|nr:hypothetical protein [Spirochaetia bacterium]